MPHDPLETLRQVNQNLRSALLLLRPERKSCSVILPQDFSALLAQLLRAAECLRHRPDPAQAGQAFAAALEKEAAEYRRNLEEIKRFLPALQLRLLAEKSRLETARKHVADAAAWDQIRKKTL